MTDSFPPGACKEFIDIQATIEPGFTLKRVRDMTRPYGQIHRTDKYPEHSSIISQVCQMEECLLTSEVILGSSPVAVI